MKLEIELAPEVAERLMEEVRAGRYANLEEAVLARLGEGVGTASLEAGTARAEALREGIERARRDRSGDVEAAVAFARVFERAKQAGARVE